MQEYSIVFNFSDSAQEQRFINDIKKEYANCTYSMFVFSVIDIKTDNEIDYLFGFVRSVVKNYNLSPEDGVVIYSADEISDPDFNPYNSGLMVAGDKREFMDFVGMGVCGLVVVSIY